jgi:Rod binding domain-containing protein
MIIKLNIVFYILLLLIFNSFLAFADLKSPLDRKKEQLKIVSEELEATLVAQYLNSMQAGIKIDSMFGGGSGEKIYREMLNQEYAKHLKLGLADDIYQKLVKRIEVKTKDIVIEEKENGKY